MKIPTVIASTAMLPNMTPWHEHKMGSERSATAANRVRMVMIRAPRMWAGVRQRLCGPKLYYRILDSDHEKTRERSEPRREAPKGGAHVASRRLADTGEGACAGARAPDGGLCPPTLIESTNG